jgi:hypothetical protein
MTTRALSVSPRALSVTIRPASVAILFFGLALPSCADAVQETVNTLTPEERTAGFELLFDGTSLASWRGFGRPDIPGGWSAADGVLTYTPGVESGDLITVDTYSDFELRLEWKLSPGGNSGVFFGVVEGVEHTY